MAVGALEPKFNRTLFEVLGVKKSIGEMYANPAETTAEMEKIFKSKTREEWMQVFEGKNACVVPVLDLEEAPHFKHNEERENFEKEGGEYFPKPAPRMYTIEEYKQLRSKI
ncbi:hypothetical protein OESDEN_00725 [Oesophagostomum dentatum]|uniref:Uncharacterized protein n=1 Tax=Oesophagostomum dentatum TaxID=61180 RepID=A0A0B1TV27_OESDE|nr:hypothetical protein OESDEN_00725 [Oesophagostomum dentatum]